MPQMHHREPGYIPAIFEEKPYTSIVNDGIHVDFAMVRLAKRELGWTPRTTFDQLVREMVESDLRAAERDALVRKHGFDAYNVRET